MTSVSSTTTRIVPDFDPIEDRLVRSFTRCGAEKDRDFHAGRGRAVSGRHLSLPEGDGHTPVILGDAGDDALGAVTPTLSGSFYIPSSARLNPAHDACLRGIRALGAVE